MTARVLREGDGKHHCALPDANRDAGTLAKCDECGAVWKLRVDTMAPPPTYKSWSYCIFRTLRGRLATW